MRTSKVLKLGFTLLEVLIASVLGVLVVAAIFSLGVGITNQTQAIYEADSLELRKSALRAYLTGKIRSAYGSMDLAFKNQCVYSITGGRLQIISETNNGIEKHLVGLYEASELGADIYRTPDAGGTWVFDRHEKFDDQIQAVDIELNGQNCSIESISFDLQLSVGGKPSSFNIVVSI